MVISNDEPDIAVGGVYDAPIATAVPASAASTFNDPNKKIERTTNADGSLAVKVTTTSLQSNGYRDVTIEYFYVPASMAGTVIMSMDATGEPPSSLYMTKMEQQVLPPGTGGVVSHAPSAPQTVGATATAGGGYPAPQPYVHHNTAVVGGSSCEGGKGACVAIAFVAVVAIAIVAGVLSKQNTDNNWPTPAPWNSPPSPWNPTPWNPPTPRPTQTGCTDTPDWVDKDGDGCDFYENSRYSCNINSFQGSMGPATKHCCTCGGGSTYAPPTPTTAPTPLPSRAPTTPRPTQPSACIDTPGFRDSSGWGCNKYKQYDFFCDGADVFKGDMGSATEHCCACGGGNVPSKPSKAPAIFNTPSVAPTPPTPVVAVPTLASKGEMDSNLSNTNPFRSPSAAKED